jgi:hypothetical protein
MVGSATWTIVTSSRSMNDAKIRMPMASPRRDVPREGVVMLLIPSASLVESIWEVSDAECSHEWDIPIAERVVGE